MLQRLKPLYAYLKARIEERSTLGDIVVAISGAAVLPYPWSAVAFGVGLAKALIPDKPK
jgi:hypothetical protein